MTIDEELRPSGVTELLDRIGLIEGLYTEIGHYNIAKIGNSEGTGKKYDMD